jgi:hypothetical protein
MALESQLLIAALAALCLRLTANAARPKVVETSDQPLSLERPTRASPDRFDN